MVLPRPTVLRGFAPSRFIRSAPRTANRAIARRGYASGHGGAHPEPSSDIPWALGAVAFTVPTCWYLWPSASHADHHEHQPETKHERSEALTHEGDEKEPVETEEVETPENKGETDDVQFKGKTSDGDEDNRQDDTRKVEDDGKGGKKLRIDSAAGKDLGAGPNRRDDGSESAATAKTETGGEGDMTSKQAGISSTPTRHSTDITNDPEKSKKGEGVPETAKSQGTVSTNRPQPEKTKGEDQDANPNPEAAKEKAGDKTEDKTEDKSEEKSEDKPEEKSEEKSDDKEEKKDE